MKRALFVLLLVGCNKPSEDSCKKAIENMRKLLGTSTYSADISPDIRRCRGGSTTKAVECAANAKTLDELTKCEFVHFDKAGSGSGSGSGSSAPGSGSAK